MQKFKVGDEIVFIGCDGSTYTETIDSRGEIPGWQSFHIDNVEPFFAEGRRLISVNSKTTNKTLMSSITSFLKNVSRSEPEKSFVKAGFLDENENITTAGKEALEYVLWEANKDGLKKIADQVISAAKEK